MITTKLIWEVHSSGNCPEPFQRGKGNCQAKIKSSIIQKVKTREMDNGLCHSVLNIMVFTQNIKIIYLVMSIYCFLQLYNFFRHIFT
jgi:hypothetical protein